MQIAKPQVHLKKVNSNNTYHIHVITWMDQTRFCEDGHEDLPSVDDEGVFTVTLRIKESSTVPDMNLLTPVIHTLTLTGINLTTEAPFLEVQVVNSSNSNSFVGKRKMHKDDADDSAMPSPIIR